MYTLHIYYARMSLKKKINLIHFFENFLKVENKKPYNAS